MTFAIAPITPAVAALAADLGVALQPGTVVNAQVLQVLDSSLVRIAIASLTLDVATAKPLQQGQTLQLAVAQSANGLTLTPVTTDAGQSGRGAAVIVDDIPLAPRATSQMMESEPFLTPQETRAVAVAAQTAVTRQAGLSPLFANLSMAVASGNLPQPVLLAAAQVLGLRRPSTEALSGPDIKTALQSSGLTMEASLASPTANAPPDLKSMLLVLRQVLLTWLEQEQAPPGRGQQAGVASPPQARSIVVGTPTAVAASEPLQPVVVGGRPVNAGDTKNMSPAAAVALKALDLAADNAEPVAGAKNLLVAQLIASASRPLAKAETEQPSTHVVLPPVRGAVPVSQAVAASTLASDTEPSIVVRQLIADTDGALARQTLLQIASLPDRADAQALRIDPAQPRWNFEIPFITPQGTAMAQFEIARDGGGTDAEASQRVWRARFSLDIEPAGPVHALISFTGDTTSVKMWAERPATAAQLRATAGQLTQSLDRAALKTGDIVVADGAPSRGKTASAGHFLNRAT